MSPRCAMLVLCLTAAGAAAASDKLAELGDRLEALEEAVAAVSELQRAQSQMLVTLTGLVLGARGPTPLGGQCSADLDCHITEKAVCRARVCACPDRHWNFRNSTCRAAAAAGEPCRLSGDCAATGVSLTCGGLPRRCLERQCAALITASEYRYRLVGGASCLEGRVQAAGADWTSDSDDWWQVCATSGWTEREARVLCASLGLSGGRTMTTDGVRQQRVWKVPISCTGGEPAIHGCTGRLGRPRIGISDCSAGQTAAVRCDPPPPSP